LTDAEPRYRNLEDEFLILSPALSVYRRELNGKELEEFDQALRKAGKID
jgi:hypothetical protein